MDVLIITVFVSLVLVISGLILFVSRLRQGDFDHGDRLSLLPLEDDVTQHPTPPPQEPVAEETE
jgi:cbb3-type cytochrome oxidase maturation protein